MKPKDKELGLTADRLREVLSYDPTFGIFIWRKKSHKSSSSVKIGDIAGSVDNTGYIRIWIDGKRYVGHRLVWLYEFGFWPEHQIDHIDRNRKNNRLSNLREATAAQNSANGASIRTNTSTGVRGVTRQGAWYRVRMQRNGKKASFGLYRSLGEALNVYNAERARLGEI